MFYGNFFKKSTRSLKVCKKIARRFFGGNFCPVFLCLLSPLEIKSKVSGETVSSLWVKQIVLLEIFALRIMENFKTRCFKALVES